MTDDIVEAHMRAWNTDAEIIKKSFGIRCRFWNWVIDQNNIPADTQELLELLPDRKEAIIEQAFLRTLTPQECDIWRNYEILQRGFPAFINSYVPTASSK